MITPIPFNTIVWGIGSIGLLLFGYRNWTVYLQSNNYLNRYFALFGLVLGVSLGFTAFPLVFSHNMDTVRPYFLAGDLLLYGAILVQARIMWYIGLKHRVAFSTIITPAIAASLLSWGIEVQRAQLSLESNFVHYHYPTLSSWIIAALLAFIILPAGFFFIRRGIAERKRAPGAAVKSVAIGTAYLLIGGGSAYNYAFNHGADTLSASSINFIFYLVLIAVVVVPPVRKATHSAMVSR